VSRLRFLTAGESHGPCLLGIVEGMPAGLPLSESDIKLDLARRQKGYGRGGRMQIEQDEASILSGVAGGITTGAPIALQIENRDWPQWQGRVLPPLVVPRPGHADLAGAEKYGHRDFRLVLERASARETAMRVAVGAVARRLLAEVGVLVASQVVAIGGVVAAAADLSEPEARKQAEASPVRCPDAEATRQMILAIDEARARGDSLGGIFEVQAYGVPMGLGSYVHWDRRLDGRLAQALMSIPAIKGVEIGLGFASATTPGLALHDEIFPGPDGPERRTNRAGGLEGGVTNGQPVVLRAAMKPIPTTVTPLRSVNMVTGEAAATEYQRSDVCAVPAAAVVGEAMVAWVLAEALLEKHSADSLADLKASLERSRSLPAAYWQI